jgi:predicted transporter
MSAACLWAYFPEKALFGAGIVFAGFIVTAAAAGLTTILGRGTNEGLERSLGLAMMTVSAYFIVTALTVPHFAEIGRVYRLASHAAADRADVGGAAVPIATAFLILVGWTLGRRSRRVLGSSSNRSTRPAVARPAADQTPNRPSGAK